MRKVRPAPGDLIPLGVKRAREFASSLPTTSSTGCPHGSGRKGPAVSLTSPPGRCPPVTTLRSAAAPGPVSTMLTGACSPAPAVSLKVYWTFPTLDGVAFVTPAAARSTSSRPWDAHPQIEVKTVAHRHRVFIVPTRIPRSPWTPRRSNRCGTSSKRCEAHDEELGEQLDELRRQIGRKGRKPQAARQDPPRRPSHGGAGFAAAFDVRLVEQTTATWEFWYGLLERYAGEFTAPSPSFHRRQQPSWNFGSEAAIA